MGTSRHPFGRHVVLFLLTALTIFLVGVACAPISPVPVSPSPRATASPCVTPSPSPTTTPSPFPSVTPSPSPTATPSPSPTATPSPAPSAIPSPPSPVIVSPLPPDGRQFATLDEFWAGNAEWLLEEYDVGLPVGESDTVYRGGDEFWSYLHASGPSAGVVDSCGEPVPFPGCVTLWRSTDGGRHFALENPTCLFPCASCPCSARDHVHQQQYPRVAFAPDRAYMVYEWGASTCLRTSSDGLRWSAEACIRGTGQWSADECPAGAAIGTHPNIFNETEFGNCLVGAPPGLYREGSWLYVFVGLGRDPGHMGCLVGDRYAGAGGLRPCAANPLFSGAAEYGPLDLLGAPANPYFDFRTISSADVVRVGDHYYMAYEGVRGPSNPLVVDDQFGLGFARSVTAEIDGPWERYPGNPVLMDLPGNVGVGHADLVLVGPATYLYTATSPTTRGRYVLVHR